MKKNQQNCTRETGNAQAPDSVMAGFDEVYTDPRNYIEEITYRIWEGGCTECIRDWYAQDCPVRTPHSVTNTVDQVVEGTVNTLQEFPDRILLPEEIVVNPRTRGFYSSHRVRSPATHQGAGLFGIATGKPVCMLTIADCLCENNRIVEEWLVRDNAALALQLGLSPDKLGADLGRAAPERYALSSSVLESRWADPAGTAPCTEGFLVQRALKAMELLWSPQGVQSEPLRQAEVYHRAVRFEGPRGVVTYGLDHLVQTVSTIRAALPGGTLAVHHIFQDEQPQFPPRVSLRWSYSAFHSGPGRYYGEPGGAEVTILGISHFEFRENRIYSEWMLVDDLAVFAQIAAKGV